MDCLVSTPCAGNDQGQNATPGQLHGRDVMSVAAGSITSEFANMAIAKKQGGGHQAVSKVACGKHESSREDRCDDGQDLRAEVDQGKHTETLPPPQLHIATHFIPDTCPDSTEAITDHVDTSCLLSPEACGAAAPEQQQQQQQQLPQATKPQICFDFTKGLCLRGDKCKFSHDLATIVQFNSKEKGICFDYLRNQCQRGLLCRFSHDLSTISQQCQVLTGVSTKGRSNAICYDFVKGVCQRGSECRYSHDLGLIARTARGGTNCTRTSEVCYDYLRGRCGYGDNCKYSHAISILGGNGYYSVDGCGGMHPSVDMMGGRAGAGPGMMVQHSHMAQMHGQGQGHYPYPGQGMQQQQAMMDGNMGYVVHNMQREHHPAHGGGYAAHHGMGQVQREHHQPGGGYGPPHRDQDAQMPALWHCPPVGDYDKQQQQQQQRSAAMSPCARPFQVQQQAAGGGFNGLSGPQAQQQRQQQAGGGGYGGLGGAQQQQQQQAGGGGPPGGEAQRGAGREGGGGQAVQQAAMLQQRLAAQGLSPSSVASLMAHVYSSLEQGQGQEQGGEEEQRGLSTRHSWGASPGQVHALQPSAAAGATAPAEPFAAAAAPPPPPGAPLPAQRRMSAGPQAVDARSIALLAPSLLPLLKEIWSKQPPAQQQQLLGGSAGAAAPGNE